MVSQDGAEKWASLCPGTVQESNLNVPLPRTPTPCLTPGETLYKSLLSWEISAEWHDVLWAAFSAFTIQMYI